LVNTTQDSNSNSSQKIFGENVIDMVFDIKCS